MLNKLWYAFGGKFSVSGYFCPNMGINQSELTNGSHYFIILNTCTGIATGKAEITLVPLTKCLTTEQKKRIAKSSKFIFREWANLVYSHSSLSFSPNLIFSGCCESNFIIQKKVL